MQRLNVCYRRLADDPLSGIDMPEAALAVEIVMRVIIACGVATGLFFYLILTALDSFNINLPERWPSALLGGACAGLVFWIGPKLWVFIRGGGRGKPT